MSPYTLTSMKTLQNSVHTAFFMGLQRKHGVRVQEGQQFDIRGTVDEFRHLVNMYMFWKPGMEIYVSHVRRKRIPFFVFPEEYKRPRPSKLTNAQKIAQKTEKTSGAGCGLNAGNCDEGDSQESVSGVSIRRSDLEVALLKSECVLHNGLTEALEILQLFSILLMISHLFTLSY